MPCQTPRLPRQFAEAQRALRRRYRGFHRQRVGVTLSVFKPGAAFGNPKRRAQGQFSHAGTEYRLWVTDPSTNGLTWTP